MRTEYVVFNPLTGVHSRVASIAQAKAAIQAISNDILQTYALSVAEVVVADDETETWEAVDTAGWVSTPIVQIPDVIVKKPRLGGGP